MAASDRIRVRANGPLSGEVTVGGAKNSVLKLIAATVLAPGRYTLTNVPGITDVDTMCDLVHALGVRTSRPGPGALLVESPDDPVPEAPYELVERIRASI